jgi:hypothetical protein
MRKRTWVELSIAVLGLCLVCGAVQDVAQSQDTGSEPSGLSTGTTGTGQGTSVEAAQRQELSLLRAEVERLQQENARMREQLARTGLPAQGGTGAGTGGAGNVGIGDPNAEAPAGQVGLGDAAGEGVGGGGRAGGAQAARPDTGNEGIAAVNVIYTGRVRSVSQQQLVLEVEGISNSLALAHDVRVFRGREQLSLKNLREGTVVRASADLYTRGNPVTRIEVLPPSSRKTPEE